MPQNERHTKNKIAYYLMQSRTGDVLPQAELDEAIEKAGVHSKKSRKKYSEEMEEEGTISQVPGGWTLNLEAYRTGTITLTISPAASLGAVSEAVSDAVRRFRPLVTMELEL